MSKRQQLQCVIALGFILLLQGVTPALSSAQQTSTPEQRLTELGLTLPAPTQPVANYVPAVRTGQLLFLAGHGPCGMPHEKAVGKVGRERTVEEGYEAARQTALCLLATAKAELGNLHKIARIVRVFGMVNAVDGFDQHPKVINGCSDLLVALFGERGKHARAAVGMASLPFNWTVEIEMLVEVAEP
ncbi:MAG TPA: RidA family protein [Methylomirabilota bacterium]|nr:RidA family protein [Methylomirabilota bacterium]